MNFLSSRHNSAVNVSFYIWNKNFIRKIFPLNYFTWDIISNIRYVVMFVKKVKQTRYRPGQALRVPGG